MERISVVALCLSVLVPTASSTRFALWGGASRGLRASSRPSWLASSTSLVEVDEADSEDKRPGCRGLKKKRAQDKYNSWCDDEVGLFLLNGQLIRSQWCLSQPHVGKPKEQCADQKKFKMCTFMYFACKAPKRAAKKCCVGWEAPQCAGKEAQWQEDTKAKCKRRFGPKSVWDFEKEGCKGIWKNCRPGMEDVCCTQPEGAMSLDDYCAEERKRIENRGGDLDPACKADPVVSNLKANLMSLPVAIDGVSTSALNAGKAAAKVSGGAAKAAAKATEGAAKTVVEKATEKASKEDAGFIPTDATQEDEGKKEEDEEEKEEAAAAVAAKEEQEDHAKHVERQKAECDNLSQKMDKMKSDVLSLVGMQKNKEFGNYDQDPDLNGKVDETIKRGGEMPSGSPCVVKEVEVADEEEDDDAEAETSPVSEVADGMTSGASKIADEVTGGASKAANEVTGGASKVADGVTNGASKILDVGVGVGSGAADEMTSGATKVADEMREASGEGLRKSKRVATQLKKKTVQVIETNKEHMKAMLAWAGNMTKAVDDVETGVHPHGCKWWRYRYQYTIVEILILMVVVPLHFALIFCLLYCGGLTGELQERQRMKLDPMHLYHYAYLAFVFHCTAIATVGFVAWGLWWSTGFWDWFAITVRLLVGEKWGIFGYGVEVPYFGESYYWQLKEMLFHLFGGFALFTLLILLILREYSKAHFEWKHMENEAEGAEQGPMLYSPGAFNHFEKLKVNAAKHFKAMAGSNPTWAAVLSELGMGPEGTLHDFRFYRYLTLALNTSGASLALPSWPTVVAMLVYFFVILFLSFTMKLPWLFFLWPFVVVAFLMFVVFFFLSRYLENVAEELPPREQAPLPWLTIERFSSMVQIILILICYSFTRLIFSRYVWKYYFWIAVRATIGFVVIFFLVWFLASRICKHTVCSLALPPNGSKEEVLDDLRYVATAEKTLCLRCGAKFPGDAAFCRKCGEPRPTQFSRSEGETIRYLHGPPQLSDETMRAIHH